MFSRMLATVTFSLAVSAGALAAQDNPLTESETWDLIRDLVIGDSAPQDGAGVLSLMAPYRADSGAKVPVTLDQVGDDPIRKLTLVIDENPAPVAATIEFGEAMAPIHFETRIRVDKYSNVRAVADADGGEYMSGAFVKASGGCSAPGADNPLDVLARMGDMELRHFPDPAPGRREAEVMIRHPNYSGLQRDQVTHLFVPAHFIDHLEVKQGDELLFSMDAGISISEDPTFRFDYTDNGSPDLTIEAHDTEGNVFRQVIAKPAAS